MPLCDGSLVARLYRSMRVCDFLPFAFVLLDADVFEAPVLATCRAGWSGRSEAGMENDAGG